MFNINFFQRNGQRPRFSQTYRGARQRGDWTTSNTIYIFKNKNDCLFGILASLCHNNFILKYQSKAEFTNSFIFILNSS